MARTKMFDPTTALSIREHEMTLEEIGAALGGLSKERVRQIEAVALRKFKAGAEALGMEPGEALDAWRRAPGIFQRNGNTRRAAARGT